MAVRNFKITKLFAYPTLSWQFNIDIVVAWFSVFFAWIHIMSIWRIFSRHHEVFHFSAKFCRKRILSLVNKTYASKFGLEWNLKDVKSSKKIFLLSQVIIFWIHWHKSVIRLNIEEIKVHMWTITFFSNVNSIIFDTAVAKWKLRSYYLYIFFAKNYVPMIAITNGYCWIISDNQCFQTIFQTNIFTWSSSINFYMEFYSSIGWIINQNMVTFWTTELITLLHFAVPPNCQKKESFWAG